MVMKENNIRLYAMGAEVPEEAMRPISAGRLKGMTDINPMWRIKRLTEMFGPCGVGWWYEIVDKRIVDDEITKQRAAFVDILLYFVDPETGENSHGIPGTGGASFVAQERSGPYLSDECFKMALTDAISVAAKALGVGAKIYYAKDRDKYPTDLSDEPKETPPQKAKAKPEATPPKPEAAKPEEPQPHFICESCGKPIVSYIGKNNIKVGVRTHVESSRVKFGRVLCLDCIKDAQELLE